MVINMIYNVNDYGAVGDGMHIDTHAIQAAIDACGQAGGGRVLLTGGHTYRCGSLVLRSCVELHLEMGAILKGSDRLEDYDLFGRGNIDPLKVSVPTYENCEYSGGPSLFFLYAKDCEYISITGQGKIDGNESIYYGAVTPWHIDGSFYPRVPLLFLEHVQHLTLREVTLTGSAFWTTHLVGCEDVLIDGIRILNNLKLANCDGIDPDHCRNVRIVNCHIECADDCIVFKNTAGSMKYGPCENILVSNCTLTSTSAAIKFGTESEALFRNIIVQNCIISRSNRGISMQLRDKGSIENVTFSNIHIDTRQFSSDHWWGKAEPIAITALKRKEEAEIGHIRNVTFENISCNSENGILIYGENERNISDIYFSNVALNLTKKTDWPKGTLDLRPCIGDGRFQNSVHALCAHNASHVEVSRFQVTVDENLKDSLGEIYEVVNCDALKISPLRELTE
nr:glycosyl hydrolase family 28 protein [uncultured Acetatifactor sp.]